MHLLTRRSALRHGAIAVAAFALLDGATVASAKVARGRVRPRIRAIRKGWRRARFEPHVGAAVRFRPDGAPAVRARLVAVEDLAGPDARLAGSQRAYALRFRAPRSQQIGQGMVAIRHPRFGVVRLFVTPSATGRSTQDYVAIVNRQLPKHDKRARH